MSIKYKWDHFIKWLTRSYEREMEMELLRLMDAMEKLEPNSKEYGEIYDRYIKLVEKKNELKKARLENDTKVIVVVVSGIIGIIGMFGYRKMLESAEEPYFREFGKWALNICNKFRG